MSTTTQEIELKKPELNENVNLDEHFNKNWDRIDSAFRKRMKEPVADIAALKSLNTTDFLDKVLIVVDGLGLYRFDKDSAVVNNNDTVIQPTAGGGRWIRMARFDGSVTDMEIGNRTITDTIVPAADIAALTTLLSNLAYMIKAITGKGSWRTAPASTLEAANTHISDQNTPHGATSAATAGKLIMRDASGRAKVNAPAAADDIARKDTVDNAIAALLASAPATLDTLNELAAALGNDPNFATTIMNLIGTKETPAGAQAKVNIVMLPPVADIAALKAINITNVADKVIILVENSGLYRYDSNNEWTNNNNTVVAPNTGVGRWIRITPPQAGVSVLDLNGNELLKYSSVANAVNEITIKNASTTNTPEIQPTGDDTNISLELRPKGTGEVRVSGDPIITKDAPQIINGKTLMSPRISGGLYEPAYFTKVLDLIGSSSSAANSLAMYNSTGSPGMYPTGPADNIDFLLNAKGAGRVKVYDSGYKEVATIEEGYWAPVIKGSSKAGANTYYVQNGRYYKVGKKVYIQFQIVISAKDATMSGLISVAGLPFPIDSGFGGGLTFIEYIDIISGKTGVSLDNNGMSLDIYLSQWGDNVGSTYMSTTSINTSSTLYGFAEYITT